MSVKKDILWRVNVIFLLLCLFGAAIFFKALYIQTVEGEKWRSLGRETMRVDTIEGGRGNIYADNDKLLVTSMPLFKLHIDLASEGLTDKVFKENIDSLSIGLAQFYNDTTPKFYKEVLFRERKAKNRYFTISDSADYNQLNILKNLPILNRNKFSGGIIVEPYNQRKRPYSNLAQRTIGYIRNHSKPIGIEASFNGYLRGTSAPRTLKKYGNSWVPTYSNENFNVENGNDVHTNIDITMQEVAQTALYRCMLRHNAEHGCAIVMETATGKIKAIANLGKNQEGQYIEDYNYAIAEKNEPGSTFKIAALTTLLDKNLVTDTTLVDIEGGQKKYADKTMTDSHYYPYNEITLSKAIEISSNVGISKLVTESFASKPEEYVANLQKMMLDQPTGIELDGEPLPTLIKPSDKEWSAVSLPWMAIGYGIEITPLQMLTFVNGIANNGTIMKPYLVSKITNKNNIIKEFKPTIVAQNICKPETALKVRQILAGVVKNGTAKEIFSEELEMAGKTGTAKIADKNNGYRKKYNASFVGFFPIENPAYTAIIVISQPSVDEYSGGAVAAPVFKDIAEKVYASTIQNIEPLNANNNKIANSVPKVFAGNQNDIQFALNQIGVSNEPSTTSEWVMPNKKDKSIELQPLRVIKNLVPNVISMGLRDAVHILENQGLRVKLSGRGQVTHQSPMYGTHCKKGDVVVIELH